MRLLQYFRLDFLLLWFGWSRQPDRATDLLEAQVPKLGFPGYFVDALGRKYERMGHREKAIELYTAYLRHRQTLDDVATPYFPKLALRTVRCLEAEKKFLEAIEMVNLLRRSYPVAEMDELLVEIGRLHFLNGEYTEAVRYLTRVKNPETWSTYADILLQAQMYLYEFLGVRETLRKLERLQPQLPRRKKTEINDEDPTSDPVRLYERGQFEDSISRIHEDFPESDPPIHLAATEILAKCRLGRFSEALSQVDQIELRL
jgi:tetratricopeptide (TPR) repeat protein